MRKGNQAIVANVYQIDKGTSRLPDFDEPEPIQEFCMVQYNISNRKFDTGFPNHPELIEWFAIDSYTRLIVGEEGTFTFALNSDDGSKLFIDGELLIDNDGVHAVKQKQRKYICFRGIYN